VTFPSQVDIARHHLVLQRVETREYYKFEDVRK